MRQDLRASPGGTSNSTGSSMAISRFSQGMRPFPSTPRSNLCARRPASPWRGVLSQGLRESGCADRGHLGGNHEHMLVETMDQAFDVIEHLVRKIRVPVFEEAVQEHQDVAEAEDPGFAGGQVAPCFLQRCFLPLACGPELTPIRK